MTGDAVQAGALWTWPDALFAAVLAVGLSVLFAVPAVRLARPSATAPAVTVALVLALSGTVLSHGLPVVRLVVAAVVVAALTTFFVLRSRAPRTVREHRNEIASPIRR